MLAHIRTQRNGLIQTPEQLRYDETNANLYRILFLSASSTLAGMKELDELEQSEGQFNESDTDLSTESDNSAIRN